VPVGVRVGVPVALAEGVPVWVGVGVAVKVEVGVSVGVLQMMPLISSIWLVKLWLPFHL